jgi:hypothetical protein
VVDRPILIDEKDGACNICASHQQGKCDECGKAIPVYENMSGNGFQSPLPSHFHLEMVSGVQGRRAKFAELCLACHKKAYKKAYPDIAV